MNAAHPSTLRHFQLKVTLRDTDPPVWRQFRVPGNCTLDRLHRILQTLMGWHDMHLHDFQIAGHFYGRSVADEDDGELLDERAHSLDRVAKKGTRIEYRYDFGDDWRQDIHVEAVAPAIPGASPIECLDGARAAPPEDCGGPPGYDLLLQILAHPEHPQHAWFRQHYEGHDPEHFNPGAINRALRGLR